MKLRDLDDFLLYMIINLNKVYPKKILRNPTLLLNFDSPSCGHRMKIKENKIVRVKYLKM